MLTCFICVLSKYTNDLTWYTNKHATGGNVFSSKILKVNKQLKTKKNETGRKKEVSCTLLLKYNFKEHSKTTNMNIFIEICFK